VKNGTILTAIGVAYSIGVEPTGGPWSPASSSLASRAEQPISSTVTRSTTPPPNWRPSRPRLAHDPGIVEIAEPGRERPQVIGGDLTSASW